MILLNNFHQSLVIIVTFIFAWFMCCRSTVTVNIDDSSTSGPMISGIYSLTCIVSGAFVTTYQWIKNDDISLSETSAVLSFTSLTLSDAGLYTCIVIVNSISYSSSRAITLQLPIPDSVTVTSDPVSPIQPLQLPDVIVTCTVELSSDLDNTPVTLSILLTAPTGSSLINTNRSMSGSIEVIVSSFGRPQSGNYSCTADVSSHSQYLISSSFTNTTIITTGVYLSYNQNVMQNDSTIGIIAIGTSLHQNPVVCTSDRMPCCQEQPQYGDWYFPNGTKIKHKTEEGVVAFHRSRDNAGNVFLFRTTHLITSPTGKFCCEIEDILSNNQILCVNILFVEISDGEYEPVAGQTYTLTCHVFGVPSNSVTYQWLFNGILDSTNASLWFSPLRLSQAGMYTCRATVNIDDQTYMKSKNIPLQIPPPQNVTATSDPISPVSASESSVTLTCTVELSPAVDVQVTVNTEWTGPDGLRDTNIAQAIMGSTTTYSSTATVNSFGTEKSGNYTCRAFATALSTSNFLSTSESRIDTVNLKTVYLSRDGIIVQPESTLLITDIGNSLTHQHTLICNTSNTRLDAGNWLYPDETIVGNEGPFSAGRAPNGGISLYRRDSDVMLPTGRFCCSVSDDDNNNIMVLVCVTIVSLQIEKNSDTSNVGQEYTLTCRLSGSNTATYKWRMDGNSTILSSEAVLNFPYLQLSNAGRYTCTVSINTRICNISEDIYLQLPSPQLVTFASHPSQMVDVGAAVFLNCSVEYLSVGVALSVNIHILHPNGTLISVTNETVTNSHFSRTGFVNSFGRNNSGIYSCTVSITSTNPFLQNSDPSMATIRVTTGVYLFLNERVVEPDSNIFITDIGSSQQNPLVCITDKMPCCTGYDRAGEWVFPDDTFVPIMANSPTQFYRNRGPSGQVILYRVSENVITPTGRFCCRVPDALNNIRNICVNIVLVQITSEATPTVGQNYSLTCSFPGADSTDTVIYQWIKNNEQIPIATNNILKFMPIMLSDAGSYICSVSFNSMIYSSGKDLLIKLPTPTHVTISSNQHGYVTVGSTVIIQCSVLMERFEVRVNVTIHLTNPQGNELITSTHSLSVSDNIYTSTVIFRSFRVDQSGTYTCRATYFSPDNHFLLESVPHIETLQISIGVNSTYTTPSQDREKLFQLRLLRVTDCLAWVDRDILRKVEDILEEVATNVEQRCQCGFNQDQITRSAFQCFPDSPQAVTYRAVLRGTVNTSSSEIISHIKQWVAGGVTISIQNVLISVDTNCVIEIISNHDKECEIMNLSIPMRPNGSTNQLSSILSGVISTVFIMVVFVCMMIAVVLCLKFRKKQLNETSDLSSQGNQLKQLREKKTNL